MRSIWKIPHIDFKLLFIRCKNKILRGHKKKRTRNIVFAKRSTTILRSYIGFAFGIYSGRRFKVIKITSKMIGHKFGEFVFTRRVGSGAQIHMRKKVQQNVRKR